MDTSGHDVIGRETELTALADFLDRSEALPGAFLLEGEAGIGKTTLWRRGIELASARSYRVLSCRPSGSEAQLSFAGLGDLLDDVLDEVLGPLPSPQRRALEVALLLADPDGPPPDQRAVALAFLGALRAVAHENQVALAVDDVQWLDRSSAFVLEFALRRLREERIAALFGLRRSHEQAALGLERALPEERLRRLEVGPLSLGAIHRMLSERLGLVLSRPKLRRLHELSGGNPLFALELGRAYRRAAIRLEVGETLPGTLATLVEERLSALPAQTRTPLLAASALSQPTFDLVAQAAGEDPHQSLGAALAAHVIELDGDRIRFSHPLLSSAVYAAASIAERQHLHRRLADLVAEPEERARHLALAAERPDREISAALEDAARRALRRGAVPAAAELSEQARRLTPVDQNEDRHRRTIQSATYAFGAGAGLQARALFEEALTAASVGTQRAEALAWLGTLEEYDGDLHVGVELFREGLSEAGDDLALRAQIEDWLGDSLFLMRTDLETALAHARSAVALADQIDDDYRRVSALAGEALIGAALGRADWRAALERAAEIERNAEPVHLIVSPDFHRSIILTWLDELDEACAILCSLCGRAEERGEESALPFQLANLSLAEHLAGRWEDAATRAREGIEIAEQTGQEPARLRALGAQAMVKASRGEVERARSDAHATLVASEKRGVMMATMAAASGLGLLELALGDADAAHDALGPVVERVEAGGVREPGSVRFVFDDVEALIELGRTDEAEALLERWEARARKLDRASALAAAGRCRGLLSAAQGDLEGALTCLELALVQHERAPIPFDRARTLLVLGSTRRRGGVRRAAREALEEARAIFEELGAAIWAETARAELARIGGRRASGADLTATEERVAELVAQGLTNRAVADELFVSDRTVEGHLTRIYAKLGVRSRAELARHFVIRG
jgi:DNA-binding CsgD family transcriptional regulator